MSFFKLFFFWLALLSGALAGLPAAARDEPRSLNVVFIPKSSNQMFWDLVRQGASEAVRDDGKIQLTWRGPAHNEDTDSQIRILQYYTRPDVDAILIAPTNRTQLTEPVRAAAALGIKVVVVDSTLDDDAHLHVVGTDNLRAGEMAARHMARLLGNKGQVLVLRTIADSSSTDDRAQGFLSYLKQQAPGVVVAEDRYGGGSVGQARRSAIELLKRHPSANGIFTVNESSTDGMLRALREAGLAGKRKFIGFDTTDRLRQGLDQREIDGLVVQNPRQMGLLAVQAAAAAGRGAPFKNKTIHTEAILVTPENLNSPEVRQLLCLRC